MGKVTKVKNHLSNDELEKKIKETVGFWRVQKWLIIYNAQNYPRISEEIANHLAVSKALVNKTVSEYNRFGVAAIETVGRGGRKNAYMSVEQEKEFVGSYISRSQKGQIVTVQEIQEDFENGKYVYTLCFDNGDCETVRRDTFERLKETELIKLKWRPSIDVERYG